MRAMYFLFYTRVIHNFIIVYLILKDIYQSHELGSNYAWSRPNRLNSMILFLDMLHVITSG